MRGKTRKKIISSEVVGGYHEEIKALKEKLTHTRDYVLVGAYSQHFT